MADVIDDSTQLPVEGADATQAFLAGQAEVSADPDGRVRVIANGRFGSVDARELETFLRTNPGARLATAQERQERLLQREYGEGIGNELRAAGEAVLRTTTLGLSDVAIGAAGGEEAREGLREREARNRLAAATGTGVGIVATALATGGTGALARGLSATPAGLAMRGGAALTRLGEGAGVAGRAAAMAAGSALEGAVLGAGQGVSEWALNPDAQERTAERLMAGLAERAGEGALLGGLAGGALSLGGSALGAGARKAKSTLSKIFRSGADDVADVADDVATRRLGLTSSTRTTGTLDDALDLTSAQRGTTTLDDMTTIELEAGRNLGPDSPLKRLAEGATARQRFAARQQVATDEITKALTEIAETADELTAHTHVGLKRNPVLRALRNDPPGNLDAAVGTMADTVGKIQDELLSMAGRTDLFERQGLQAINRALKEIDDITGSLVAPRNLDDLADAYIGLDRLKRRFGRIQRYAGSGANADKGVEQVLRRQYEELRGMLEDTVFGGGVTTLQKEVNQAWSSYLDYARAYDGAFALPFGSRTARSTVDGFEKIAAADPSKVGSALNRLGSAENAHLEDVLLTGSKRHVDLLETLGKHYDVPAELRSSIAKARKQVESVSKQVAELKRLRTVGDKFDETIQALSDIPGIGGSLAKVKVSTGRALSLAMEGQAGAKSSKALGIATEQASEAALEDAISRATGRMSSLQRIYVSAHNVGAKITDAAQKYARTFGAASSRAIAGGAATSGTRADRQQRFEKAYARVQEFERDPQAAIRRAFRVQHSLGTVAPTLASAYAAKTVQAGAFLASKLPVGATAAHMFPRHKQGEAPRVNDVEMREFLEYVDAIERPLAILDQLEKGRVSPRTVEAVREVYPKLYEDIQREIMTAIEDVETTPPYNARLNLGILFDLPTDAALEPDALQMLQTSANAPGADQAAQNPENQAILSPSRRSAPDTAGLLETKSVRSMGAL